MVIEVGTLIPALALGTLAAVLAAAALGKRWTRKARKDPRAPKSALAVDGPKRDQRR
jgi:hypothetical protein